MKTLTSSLTKLTILSAIMLSAFAVNYLLAWDGPTGVAPIDNVDAPLNAGSVDQEKTGGVKAGSFWSAGNIQADGRIYYFGDTQSLVSDGSSNGALNWYSGSATTSQMMFRDPSGKLFGKVYGDQNGARFGLVDGDFNWSYRAVKDVNTQFLINNTVLMTLLADGKVGIGTHEPETRLEVFGDVTIKNETPAIHFRDSTSNAERAWRQQVNGSNMVFTMDRNGDGKFNSDDNPNSFVLNAGDKNASKEDDYASFANDVIIGGRFKMNFGERLYLSRFEDTAGNNNMIWADNNSGYNVNIASRGKHVLVGDVNTTGADATFIFGKKNKPGYDYSGNFTQLFNVNSSGLARSLGGWGTLSDARSKTNVAAITDPLQKVEALNGVTFDWKDNENHPQVHDLGLIAQEVQEVLPEVVYQDDEDMDGMLTVDYGRITAVLIEAVKELSAENDELEARIAELEATSN